MSTTKKPPAYMLACCQTNNPLYLTDGVTSIVDGVFYEPQPGQVIAHEVIVAGKARVTVRGPVRVVAFGGFVQAEEESRVYAKGDSQIRAMRGSEVHACSNSQIEALSASQIWVVSGAPIIRADLRALVILVDNVVPKLKLRGAATVVHFPQGPAVAQAA
jgi:hypothetical protein